MTIAHSVHFKNQKRHFCCNRTVKSTSDFLIILFSIYFISLSYLNDCYNSNFNANFVHRQVFFFLAPPSRRPRCGWVWTNRRAVARSFQRRGNLATKGEDGEDLMLVHFLNSLREYIHIRGTSGCVGGGSEIFLKEQFIEN